MYISVTSTATGTITSETSISLSQETSQNERAFTSNEASSSFLCATSIASDVPQKVSEILDDVKQFCFYQSLFEM